MKWISAVFVYLSIEVPVRRRCSFVSILRLCITDGRWTSLRFFRYHGESTTLQAWRRWSIRICNEIYDFFSYSGILFRRVFNHGWSELLLLLLCELMRKRPCVCSGGPGEFGGHTRNRPIRVAAWSVLLPSSNISVQCRKSDWKSWIFKIAGVSSLRPTFPSLTFHNRIINSLSWLVSCCEDVRSPPSVPIAPNGTQISNDQRINLIIFNGSSFGCETRYRAPRFRIDFSTTEVVVVFADKSIYFMLLLHFVMVDILLMFSTTKNGLNAEACHKPLVNGNWRLSRATICRGRCWCVCVGAAVCNWNWKRLIASTRYTLVFATTIITTALPRNHWCCCNRKIKICTFI